MQNKPLLGFIGQGWIGKHYADHFEDRKFKVIRYALEKPYIQNKDKIKECDITFIAVPTPTTTKGFNYSILREVMPLVGANKIAVIKSTILPEVAEKLQTDNPAICVLNSPEFLTESTAKHDVDNPDRNIIGIPKGAGKEMRKKKAEEVMEILPKAPYNLICDAEDASLIKYGGNCLFYTKVVFINLLHDLARMYGCKWDTIKEAMIADPRIDEVHMNPVHKKGRGAGGHCFIKDFAAFRKMYEQNLGSDKIGLRIFRNNEARNINFLLASDKDIDLLEGVYGKL